jgi:hypothetical protein
MGGCNRTPGYQSTPRPFESGRANIDQTRPSSHYRERAADLRAAADATTNASLKYQLLAVADDYETRADRAGEEQRTRKDR